MGEPHRPQGQISSVEVEVVTPQPMAAEAGPAGAVPGAEAAPENSSVLELRLTDESRWQDLIDLLLTRADRLQGLERSGVLQRVASIYQQQLGDLASAFVTLEAAQADDPANEELFDYLLLLANASGRTAEMEAACRRALEASPRHESALATLQDLARRAERWNELAELLARHADVAGDRPSEAARLVAELATILEQRLGDRQRARQAWEDALRLDPDHREAVLALERLYAGGSDVQAYLDILERRVEFVESDAEFVAIQRTMAELWEARMRKPLRACQALENILRVQPADARVQRDLQRLYRQDQQWQELAQLHRRQIAAAGARDEQAELTYRMGEAWARFGDLEQATRAYGDALKVAPDHAEALAAVARLSERAGDLGEAYEAMLKRLPTITDASERAAVLHRMGVIALENLGEPAAAEQHWSSAIELEPKRLETLRALVQLYQERGQPRDAARVLALVAEACPDGTEKVAALIAAADLHRGPLADSERAFDLYAEALELDPGSVPAAEGMVEVGFALEEWGSVVRFAEMLLEPARRGDSRPARSDAEAARLHLTLAKAAQHLGDATKATQHYRRAPQLDAALQPDLRSWADALFDKKDWRGAAALYEIIYQQSAEAAPPAERVEVAFRLGRARLEFGENRAARDALQAAVALDGRHKPSLVALARVRQELGDHRGAVAARTALLDLVDSADERFSLLCETGALLRDKLIDRRGALDLFLRAVEVRPDDRHLLHVVLELHTAEKRWSEALPILKRLAATESDPNVRSRTLVAAGKICQYEIASPEEAIDLYEEALDLEPDDLKTFGRIEPPDALPRRVRVRAGASGLLTRNCGLAAMLPDPRRLWGGDRSAARKEHRDRASVRRSHPGVPARDASGARRGGQVGRHEHRGRWTPRRLGPPIAAAGDGDRRELPGGQSAGGRGVDDDVRDVQRQLRQHAAIAGETGRDHLAEEPEERLVARVHGPGRERALHAHEPVRPRDGCHVDRHEAPSTDGIVAGTPAAGLLCALRLDRAAARLPATAGRLGSA